MVLSTESLVRVFITDGKLWESWCNLYAQSMCICRDLVVCWTFNTNATWPLLWPEHWTAITSVLPQVRSFMQHCKEYFTNLPYKLCGQWSAGPVLMCHVAFWLTVQKYEYCFTPSLLCMYSLSAECDHPWVQPIAKAGYVNQMYAAHSLNIYKQKVTDLFSFVFLPF